MDWSSGVKSVLETISQILTAGVAITAFSVLLLTLSFNLKERVTRTFGFILFCVVIVFSAEALGSTITTAQDANIWLRLQWIGVILLPATYLHFSDAVLSTTGEPSQGLRSWSVRLVYLGSFLFLLALPSPYLLGPVIMDQPPAPHLQPTLLTDIFTAYYLFIMLLAWYIFLRALRRTITPASRRRMSYLIAGGLGPALGSFPFLLFSSTFAGDHPILFWGVAIAANLLTGILIVIMAYAVAFFGVPWPDRVVKSRLFKWMMRGPFTASLTLAFTTLTRRAGEFYGIPYSAFVPIVMIATILLCEFLITILAPLGTRVLFWGKDRPELEVLNALQDRLLTRNDLRQFIEMVLASVCDRLQVEGAVLAAVNLDGLEVVARVGKLSLSEGQARAYLPQAIALEVTTDYMRQDGLFLVPIRANGDGNPVELLGLLFFPDRGLDELVEDQLEPLMRLSSRAALALRDRRTQEQVFRSLKILAPQVEYIQQMRAEGSYHQDDDILIGGPIAQIGITDWVKDALTHYWGGPRLTESPLLQMMIVQQAIPLHEGNPANALRAILRDAIERIRPEGERRYTSEWMLYNIIVMKFMEGKKVREIAMRLAMSEADLYRKQRVAIEAVAKAILDMESQARAANGIQSPLV